ncbi:MAG: capsular biosynthesis protein [Alphaproteobacteria bacterium]|nr:capsular biosynthesis protein [Alphaproteobacteria bacterium]MBU1281731.1 capsular biosynthesis protein [Alphaproteobacteria bacterium]MBU1572949.1 capsular biosynthesis protein [Alphaproteobacteria bacterium]MBU1828565.1 capsular biosynthesis protein [Alphaproteobacteria bacterium]MBU2077843.1 capsular biosynthesis protein [Alphaproteobacteria bacterium]
MIAYLKGWSTKKDSFFASVAKAAGGGKALPLIPLSFRGFSESEARAKAAMAVAKRQPKSALVRRLKFRLIWAQYNGARRYFTRHPDRIAMCWNGITGSRRVFMEGARDAGVPTLYGELAPFPGRMQLDPRGVNALGTVPRDPGFFTAWAAGRADRQGDEWREMGTNLTARLSRRADVGQAEADLSDEPFLFVPLQVPNDSQITMFGGWVGSVEGMIAALAEASEALPEGWHIRIKEHPSAKTSLAEPLARAISISQGRLRLDNQTDTFAQVRASRGVITINSSVGLQSFFYDKPVIVLGEAFFALPGLVRVVGDQMALHAAMTEAESLAFDPALRAAFMNYLDQVHFPHVSEGPDGTIEIDQNAAVQRIMAAKTAIGH